jgi:hypothetical protein
MTNYERRVPVEIYMMPNDISVKCAAYPVCYNLPDLIILTFDKYIM